MLPVDFLLMVNSTRDHILFITCDIFCVKRLNIAILDDTVMRKTAVYPFKVIKGYGFLYQSNARVHILLVINNNFSHILHRFGDVAA